MTQYMTIGQAAERLAVDHKTVRRMLESIGAVDVGRPGAKRRTIRIPEEALERFLRGREITKAVTAQRAVGTTYYFERRRT